MAGTYASLLQLDRFKKPTPSVEAEVTPLAPLSELSPDPVAPSLRPVTSSDPSQPVEASPRRPDPATPRRHLQRAAFDIYEDQVQAIKRLKNQRQLDLDRDVSKSEIVREALEAFFKSLT